MEHFRISNLLDIYSSSEYNNIDQKALIDFSKEYVSDKDQNQLEYIKMMQEQCKAIYMLSIDSLIKLELEIKESIIKDIPRDDIENKYSVQKIIEIYQKFTGKKRSKGKFHNAAKAGKLALKSVEGMKDYVLENDLLEYIKKYDDLILTSEDIRPFIYKEATKKGSF